MARSEAKARASSEFKIASRRSTWTADVRMSRMHARAKRTPSPRPGRDVVAAMASLPSHKLPLISEMRSSVPSFCAPMPNPDYWPARHRRFPARRSDLPQHAFVHCS